MTEITDLSETDSANTVITGSSTDGNIANMSAMDNVIQSILGLLARSLKSSIWRLRDSTDQTKLLAFDLSGLTTATTRTVAFPDVNGEIITTGGQVLSTAAKEAAVRKTIGMELGYPILHVRDERAAGTEGGSSTSGINVRVLNTVKTNTIIGASLASNLVTLPAGTYECEAYGQFFASRRTKIWLVDSANPTVAIYTYGFASWGVDTTEGAGTASMRGQFTIASPVVFQLRQYFQVGSASGFVPATNTGGIPEVYAELIFRKLK